MKNFIPVIQSSHLIPFLATFREIGVNEERAMEHVGLNPDVIYEGKAFVPEYASWHLLGHVAAVEGIDNLGSMISEQFCLDRYGVFGAHLCNAPSLYIALQRLIHDLRSHANYQNYWLREQGNYIEICRIGTPGIEIGKHQVEQHIMVFLIELVRNYLGDNWLPDYLAIQSHSDRGVASSPTLQNINLSYGQAFGVVPIHKSVFMARASHNKEIGFNISTPKMVTEDFPAQILDLLKTTLFRERTSLTSISRAIGVSQRQLQRELLQYNTSFRDLTNQIFLGEAKSLLENDELSIQYISNVFGYSNPKNFSRAFKALTGISPTEYQKHILGLIQ